MPSSHAALLACAMLGCTVSLSGCATPKNPNDPLEELNRSTYEFNQTLDRIALKPAAKGYRAVVPTPVRGGITNVFGNFRDFTTAINNVLQFKIGTALSDVCRVAVNSTVGIFGVFDVASRLGLEKHHEDFGQTLGVWGVPEGPYLVLPLLGPSNIRDSVGLIGDFYTDPEFFLITDSPENWIVFGTRIVNVRANLLEAERLLEQAALDQYAFLREAYLQRRRNQVLDGNAPRDEGEATPRRKTLRELEEELELESEEPEPPPAKP